LVGWACSADAFTCSDDAQCEGGPAGGTCVEGFCAFPSDVCSSGLQYGEHAGSASGTCVPEGGSDGGSTDTEGSGPPPPTTGPSATSLDDGPLDTSASGSEGPAPGEIELRDDELRGEFGAGTMDGVAWTGDRLTLAPEKSDGTFTSRVFDAGAPVAWQTVQWQPDGPYGKPLPDGGAAEVGYLEGGVDMAGNVLLMHFEDEGQAQWGDGTPVLDASGAGSDGEVVAQGRAIPLVEGVFGTAIDDQWETRISIPTAEAPELAFGTDDFTWALWVRMASSCSNNQVYMGVDDTDAAADLYPHLWLGCTTEDWVECTGMVNAPRAAGTFLSIHDDPDDGASVCGEQRIDGNEWHHLAVVKEGHEQAALSLYVDGVLEGEADATFAQPIEYPHDPAFTIGAFSRGTYSAVGVFDEVVVWRRAFSPGEVAAVYQRGVTSLVVAVRVCSEAECADDPPWGPRLSDPVIANGPGLEIPLVELPVGRYVQYQLELGGEMPALREVVVRGIVQ
jgi:hypothetical protein